MDRSTPSGPEHSAARAFARVGYSSLLLKLQRYATGTLHLAAMDAESAGVVEAADLVNTLVEKGLDGTLVWTLPEHASAEEIVGHACMKLFGMRSTLRRQAARTVRDDGVDERADASPDALARLLARRAVADIERTFEHDAEASAHLREMLAGKGRAEIAREIGCTAQHVDVVRNRIIRGVAALYTTRNDDREAEPSRSRPRGRDHVQTTEERPRAPAEPPRGAGGAGGRR
jgi:hypothetical protein